MLDMGIRAPAGQDRRHDLPGEDAVQLSRASLDVVDPGVLVGPLRALAQVLDQGENARLGLGVEAEVAVVADDDGVGLMGVLVAHGAGQIESQTHAVHPRACLGQALVDLGESEQGDRRCHGIQGNQGNERQRQPARSSGAQNPKS